MVKLTKLVESLEDWPVSEDDLTKTTIQCAGRAFVEYQRLVAAGDNLDEFVGGGRFNDTTGSEEGDIEEAPSEEDDSVPAIDLFSLSETKFEALNYYQVLHLPYKPHLTGDDVKKAYRKASLKYHPDKSGRGEEDAVFLKVKAAFETLSTQKQAYDSTEMPFDESVPSEEAPSDFFEEYGPVFDRNLHFDARLLKTDNNGSNGSSTNGKKAKNNRRKSRASQTGKSLSTTPPPLGDDDTPIDLVHEFYDYWTHFTSWRDFRLKAARELETAEHLENAESRYEKRWYQKEIDRQAKKLKQLEQARITTLVERAMAVDPRLVQERKRQIQEKEQKQKQKVQDVLDKKKQEEEAQLEEQKRILEEKGRKSEEKQLREKEKKMIRKAKQAFRKLVAAALEELLEKEYALEDETDKIFDKLTRDQLLRFNIKLESIQSNASHVIQAVKTKVQNLENGVVDEEDENEPPTLAPESNGAAQSNGHATAKDAAPESPAPAAASSTKKAKIPFSKEELSALAKGIKKFPPGGGNRWDQIAGYINNVCRQEIPRTKEECIEIFNQNKTSKAPGATAVPAPVTAAAASSDEDVWTEEEDKLLQGGLTQYPTSVDKNERWTSIAKCVPGKTKKQCVNRFKIIRDAIKNKK